MGRVSFVMLGRRGVWGGGVFAHPGMFMRL